jgi:hypothetical protein
MTGMVHIGVSATRPADVAWRKAQQLARQLSRGRSTVKQPRCLARILTT